MSKWTSFLKRTKEIGEAGSSLIPIIKFVLSVSGVLGVVAFTNAHFENKRLIEQYAYDVEQYEQRVAMANQYADSLMSEMLLQEEESREALQRSEELDEVVAILQTERAQLKYTLDTIRQSAISADTVSNEQLVIELQDSIIQQQDSIITTQETQITELKTVIERKDYSIYFLVESVDSLQSVIDTRPTLPEDPERLLGILPTPSRTTTAIGAFTVGVITTLMLSGK